MKKTMGEFSLEIKSGEFTDSEIMVMLGENGEWSSKVFNDLPNLYLILYSGDF